MNFRLAQPAIIVDLNKVNELGSLPPTESRRPTNRRDGAAQPVGTQSDRRRIRATSARNNAPHRPPPNPQPGHDWRQSGPCRSGRRTARHHGGLASAFPITKKQTVNAGSMLKIFTRHCSRQRWSLRKSSSKSPSHLYRAIPDTHLWSWLVVTAILPRPA